MICAFRMRTQEGIGGLMMSSRPGNRSKRRRDDLASKDVRMNRLSLVRDCFRVFERPDTLPGNRAPLRRQ